MSRSQLTLSLAIIAFCAMSRALCGEGASPSAPAFAHQAWEAFVKGDTAASIDIAKASGEELAAAFHVADLRGDDPLLCDLSLACLKAFRFDSNAKLYLESYESAARACGKVPQMLAELAKIREDISAAPSLRRQITEDLLSNALSRNDKAEADRLKISDGEIRLWARVVGPFSSRKPFQLNAVEQFELNPAAAAYTDELGKEVTIKLAAQSGNFGQLRLNDHVPQGIDGAVYTVAFLEVDAASEALLDFSGMNNCRAWLNSLPVLGQPEEYWRTGYSPYHSMRKVSLKAGINALVIKCLQSKNIDVLVLGLDGNAAKFKLVEWEAGKAALEPLRRLPGMLASQPAEESGLPEAALRGEALADQPLSAKTFMLIDAMQSANLVQEARSAMMGLTKRYPDSANLLGMAASLRFQEASCGGGDSEDRLKKEGLALARAALKLSPNMAKARMYIANYANSHEEEDTALREMREAVERSPRCREAWRDLVSLELSRDWHAIAEGHCRQAMANQLEMRADLARVLSSACRKDEAKAIEDALWQAKLVASGDRLDKLLDRSAWDEYEQLLGECQPIFTPTAMHNRRISLALAKGDLETAFKIQGEVAALYPWDEDPLEAQAKLALRLGRKDEALRLFDKAISLQREASRDYLPMLRRRSALAGEKWELGSYDATIPDSSAYVPSKYPQSHHATVLDLAVYRIEDNGAVEGLVHLAHKIFTQEAANDLGEKQLPADRSDILCLRTILPDGQVLEPTDLNELALSKAASMDKAGPGSILDYAYREQHAPRSDGSFSFNYTFQDFDTPVALSRLVLIVKESALPRLSIKSTPKNFAPQRRNLEGGWVELSWEVRALEPIRKEPLSPPALDVLRSLRVELRGQDWQGSDGNFERLLKPRGNAEIAALAKAAIAGCANNREKALAIHAAVRNLIKQNGEANTPRDAFATGQGSPAAMLELARAMFEAVGMAAWPAYINAAYDLESDLEERGQRASSFRLPAICVPLQGEPPLWLRFNATPRHFAPLDLGGWVAGSPALVRGEKGLVTFMRVRGEELERSTFDLDVDIALSANGNAQVSGKAMMYGEFAGRTRLMLDDPQAGPRSIERIALMLFPRINLSGPKAQAQPVGDFGHTLDTSRPFNYSFAGKVENLCRKEGEALAFQPFPSQMNAFQSLLAAEDRTQDFRINKDIEVPQTIHFKAPKGWAFANMPENIWWESDFGIYIVHFMVKGRELWASRLLLMPTRTLTPKQYKTLATFLKECRQSEKASVTMIKLPENVQTSDYEETPACAIRDLNNFRLQSWPEEGR